MKNIWKILMLLNTALTIGLYFFAVSARQERDKLEGSQKSILVNQDTLKARLSDSTLERALRIVDKLLKEKPPSNGNIQ